MIKSAFGFFLLQLLLSKKVIDIAKQTIFICHLTEVSVKCLPYCVCLFVHKLEELEFQLYINFTNIQFSGMCFEGRVRGGGGVGGYDKLHFFFRAMNIGTNKRRRTLFGLNAYTLYFYYFIFNYIRVISSIKMFDFQLSFTITKL